MEGYANDGEDYGSEDDYYDKEDLDEEYGDQ